MLESLHQVLLERWRTAQLLPHCSVRSDTSEGKRKGRWQELQAPGTSSISNLPASRLPMSPPPVFPFGRLGLKRGSTAPQIKKDWLYLKYKNGPNHEGLAITQVQKSYEGHASLDLSAQPLPKRVAFRERMITKSSFSQ